jgi:hypothetical protein
MKFKTSLLILALFTSIILHAQETENGEEKKASLQFSSDFMSRYVWRGTDFGRSPSIQPGLKYCNGGLTIGSWGAFSINSDNVIQEVDLYASYTIGGMIGLTVTDYFFVDETNPKNLYFMYNDITGHVYEGTLAFLGTEKIPFSLMCAYNFAGADKDKSTYIELGYNGSLKETAYSLFAGFTPAAGIYASEAGLVNVGIKASKAIEITDKFSLPVSVSLVANPTTENVYFVFGFTL